MLGTCSKSVNEPSSDIANSMSFEQKDSARRRRTVRSQLQRSDVCGRSGVQGREMRRGLRGLVAGLVLISAPPQEAFAQIQSSPPAAAVSYELPAVTFRAPNRAPAGPPTAPDPRAQPAIPAAAIGARDWAGNSGNGRRHDECGRKLNLLKRLSRKSLPQSVHVDIHKSGNL